MDEAPAPPRSNWRLALGPLLAVVVYLVPLDLPAAAHQLLAILVLALCYWVTEAIPAPVTAQELATMLYDSLHQKLLMLPDDTFVYPAHGAGSMCGKHLSTDTVSTIGVQRRYNYALQPMSQAAFVAMVTADQPEAPQYFAYDAMRNRQERPTLTQTLTQALHPLSLDGPNLAKIDILAKSPLCRVLQCQTLPPSRTLLLVPLPARRGARPRARGPCPCASGSAPRTERF